MDKDTERKDIERGQDDAEREVKGKREAAADQTDAAAPADHDDPRGEREPPQPFSGPAR
jgi:hypothetical protein